MKLTKVIFAHTGLEERVACYINAHVAQKSKERLIANNS